jgi:hypothetical protein
VIRQQACIGKPPSVQIVDDHHRYLGIRAGDVAVSTGKFRFVAFGLGFPVETFDAAFTHIDSLGYEKRRFWK